MSRSMATRLRSLRRRRRSSPSRPRGGGEASGNDSSHCTSCTDERRLLLGLLLTRRESADVAMALKARRVMRMAIILLYRFGAGSNEA